MNNSRKVNGNLNVSALFITIILFLDILAIYYSPSSKVNNVGKTLIL